MPNIAVYHPQIVHFVVALGIVGVVLRFASYTRWFSFANVAARTLLILAALASVAAAQSGTQAHGVVERIPGAGPAVNEHEDAGEWARDVLVVVGILELGAWLLERRRPKAARAVLALSALGGLVSLGTIYRAGELGGRLVYGYAGGVGTRSGDTTDVNHLLSAALYNGAMADRKAGRHEDAGRLIAELARRHPGDAQVRLLVAESELRDRNQPRAALDTIRTMHPAPNDRRTAFGMANVEVQAYVALGKKDSARVVLENLVKANPQLAARLQPRIDSLR